MPVTNFNNSTLWHPAFCPPWFCCDGPSGFHVNRLTPSHSSTPVTTYHGTVHYKQRRMQVLVDGRTAHRSTLSDMDWQTMPVPLELIERVEISRGPNSAAYGVNAFLGTINIITRNPADTAGAEVRVVGGSRDYVRTFASVGDVSESYDWRFAYEKRKFGGFDYQLEDGERAPFNDGHDINVFNYDSRLKVSSGFNADIRVGVVDGINELPGWAIAKTSIVLRPFSTGGETTISRGYSATWSTPLSTGSP